MLKFFNKGNVIYIHDWYDLNKDLFKFSHNVLKIMTSLIWLNDLLHITYQEQCINISKSLFCILNFNQIWFCSNLQYQCMMMFVVCDILTTFWWDKEAFDKKNWKTQIERIVESLIFILLCIYWNGNVRKKNLIAQTHSLASLFGYDDDEKAGVVRTKRN